MSVVFGIHLGNTSACLASYKDGKIDVVANDVGDRITPTVVAVNDSEKIVGSSAKAGLARNSSSTVVCNKKLLDICCEDDLKITNKASYKIVKEGDTFKYVLRHGEKNFNITAESIAVCLFQKLYEIASSSGMSECDRKVVLDVPLHFTQNGRMTIMRAAEEAGFEVLHIISEQGATLLGYGLGYQNPEEEWICLVYRLGGATLDVSVVEVRSGMYSICSSVHKSRLGGDIFTTVLAEYLAEEYRKKCKLDPQESRRSMAKLTAAAETCKHVLSTMSTAHCFVESLCEGVDFSYNITRARFESLLSSLLQQYTEPIYTALEKAELDSSRIQKVCLSGGSVKIPKVQQTLRELFPQAHVVNGISPDEVIAIGCARQASCLPQPIDPECQHLTRELPGTSFAINVMGPDSRKCCIIPRLTPVPVKRAMKYIIEDLGDVMCELFEVIPESPDTPKILGKICLHQVHPPTEVVLEVNLNSIGGLTAILFDRKSQKRATMKLDAPSA